MATSPSGMESAAIREDTMPTDTRSTGNPEEPAEAGEHTMPIPTSYMKWYIPREMIPAIKANRDFFGAPGHAIAFEILRILELTDEMQTWIRDMSWKRMQSKTRTSALKVVSDTTPQQEAWDDKLQALEKFFPAWRTLLGEN